MDFLHPFLAVWSIGMFGNIEWFEPVESKKYVKPKSWQGWAYLAGFAAVLLLPMKLLMAMGRTPEAFIWLLFSGGFFAFDYWKTSRAVRQKHEYDNLFVIDESTDPKTVTTSNYDLKID